MRRVLAATLLVTLAAACAAETTIETSPFPAESSEFAAETTPEGTTAPTVAPDPAATESAVEPAGGITEAVVAEPGGTTPSTMTVTGEGTAYGVPDRLSAQLVVSVIRPTASEAVSVAAQVSANVREGLLGEGVAAEDIQTADFTLHSEYDWSGPQRQFLGIRVRHAYRVKMDVADAGGTIDAALRVGWDALEVEGTSLFVEDDSELVAEARLAAWEDCEATARQVAENAGMRRGDLVAVIEGHVSVTPVAYTEGGNGEGDEPTRFEPGRVVATAQLEAVFTLEG